MFVYFSIMGNVTVNNTDIVCDYTVSNLTTPFISNVYTSELGYYNINLTNFNGVTFNEEDLILIKFTTIIDGVDYEANKYYIIKNTDITINKNIELTPATIYTSDIHKSIAHNTVDINFITSFYSNILFKLYILYNNKYILIDSATLTNQVLRLNLTASGNYKLAGYVVNGDDLLSYSETTFNILGTVSGLGNDKRYIEWE